MKNKISKAMHFANGRRCLFFDKIDLYETPYIIKWRFLHRVVYSLVVDEEEIAGRFITV